MSRFLAGLLLLFPGTIFAQNEWLTGLTNAGDFFYAATVNESSNLIGEYCSSTTGDCMWVLGMKSACKEGDSYPVLANSDIGTSNLEIHCSVKLDNGYYRYVFTDFDAINNIITKAIDVGFAVPLQAGQFRVLRFDLTGSNRALTSMLSTVNRAQEKLKTNRPSTRDVNM